LPGLEKTRSMAEVLKELKEENSDDDEDSFEQMDKEETHA